ncbi:MAG: PilZ domain-containing protein [Spirochaetia bacterium]|nr:PilZ domain-containing protein [Spirochaetia bacterium]
MKGSILQRNGIKMEQKRSLKRRHLIFFLNVYNSDTGKLMGHLVDINKEGMMLVSEDQIPVNQDFNLKIRMPVEKDNPDFLEFQAQSLWSKNDVNPVFYDTGFQFKDVSVHSSLKVAEIIKEFGFND